MRKQVEIYHDNAGGVHVVILEGEKPVEILYRWEGLSNWKTEIKNFLVDFRNNENVWKEYDFCEDSGIAMFEKDNALTLEKQYADLANNDIPGGVELICYSFDKDEIINYWIKAGSCIEAYHIDYGTWAGNEWVFGSLDDAKEIADDGVVYTQESIAITDLNDNNVAIRHWYGVSAEQDDIDPDEIISFGDFGYFDAWEDL